MIIRRGLRGRGREALHREWIMIFRTLISRGIMCGTRRLSGRGIGRGGEWRGRWMISIIRERIVRLRCFS
jgi:hypothetical protein